MGHLLDAGDEARDGLSGAADIATQAGGPDGVTPLAKEGGERRQCRIAGEQAGNCQYGLPANSPGAHSGDWASGTVQA
jgi:hypothetical protein